MKERYYRQHAELVEEVFGGVDMREYHSPTNDARVAVTTLLDNEMAYARQHQPRLATEFKERFEKDLVAILGLSEGYDVVFYTAGGTEASKQERLDGWVQVEKAGQVVAHFKMNLAADPEREKENVVGDLFYVNVTDFKRAKDKFFVDKQSTYAHMLEKASLDLAHTLRKRGVQVAVDESGEKTADVHDVTPTGKAPVLRRRSRPGGGTVDSPRTYL